MYKFEHASIPVEVYVQLFSFKYRWSGMGQEITHLQIQSWKL